MNFKEWYGSTTYGAEDVEGATMPVIRIHGEGHLKRVRTELHRLGFDSGNDFSKYGKVTHLDIWYSEFYNTFLSPLEDMEDYFEFTLEELLEVERREGFTAL